MKESNRKTPENDYSKHQKIMEKKFKSQNETIIFLKITKTSWQNKAKTFKFCVLLQENSRVSSLKTFSRVAITNHKFQEKEKYTKLIILFLLKRKSGLNLNSSQKQHKTALERESSVQRFALFFLGQGS